jgi:hypothetical protein
MGTSYDPKTVMGFNVGVISEFNLKGNLFLQPALLYTTEGSKYSVSGEDLTVTAGCIEIPVNAVYKIGLGSTKFFLNAGPYLTCGIRGKGTYGGESTIIRFGSTESDLLKRFDIGLNFGAGIEIRNFFISAHYGLGLRNLSSLAIDNIEIKSRVIGFSIGYLFGGK